MIVKVGEEFKTKVVENWEVGFKMGGEFKGGVTFKVGRSEWRWRRDGKW
jgi:hypothetical protein